MFRVVVQDSRQTPTSGKVVAWLGSYDPHQKSLQLNKEKAQFYLDHGAQPSQRAIGLLSGDGLKMPKWIVVAAQKQSTVRNPDKRRSTRPSEEAKEEKPAEEPSETVAAEEAVEVPAETKAEEKPKVADKTEEAKPEKEEPKQEEKPDKKA